MPRLSLLATAAVAVLALGACDGERGSRADRENGPRRPLKAVTTLECPDHQGGLTRVRTTPDGLSCVYAGPKGAEVALRLVRAGDGGTQAILTALEKELNDLMPSVAARLAAGRARAADAAREEAASDAADAAKEAEAARAELEAEHYEALADQARARAAGDEAEARAAEARAAEIKARMKAGGTRASRSGDGENVDVRLPGLRVKSEGDKADVRLPGISVKSDGDTANVRVGPITIKADDRNGSSNVDIDANDTEVRVRSEGEASEVRTRRKGGDVRATYILSDDEAPAGSWRMVGYEARGPHGGPLVIAVIRSKDANDHRYDDVFDDAKALVRRNAGG